MSLAKNGYQVAEGLVPKEVCALFTTYALFSEMQNSQRFGDAQVKNSYALFGDPFVECFLPYCHNAVEQAAEEPLLPTYSYYRVYRPGAELLPHKDRVECEISVSLCLGFDYCDADITYPLFINDTPIVSMPGDGVVYLGVEREHYRERFEAPKHSYHIQAFLHYVRANGEYADRANDGRVSVGYPRQKLLPYPHHETLQPAINKLQTLRASRDTESYA